MKEERKFVICTNNADYPASLERWKVYQTVSDEKARRRNLIRIIDESGEDYLYSDKDFSPINLPHDVKTAFLTLSK